MQGKLALRFSAIFAALWFSIMSGSLSVIAMLLSKITDYETSFAIIGWVACALTGGSLWYREHLEVLRLRGEKTRTQKKIELASLIDAGHSLVKDDPGGNSQRIYVWINSRTAWYQSVHEMLVKSWPELIATFTPFDGLKTGGIDPLREELRGHVFQLEGLQRST